MQGDENTLLCNMRTLKEKYACFNWELFQRFYFQTNFFGNSGNHPFQMSAQGTFFIEITSATRKREIFRSHLNKYMSRSFQTGLTKGIMNMNWMEYRREKMNGMQENKSVKTEKSMNQVTAKKLESPSELRNFKGNFFVLSAGLLVSCIIFVVEFMSFFGILI